MKPFPYVQAIVLEAHTKYFYFILLRHWTWKMYIIYYPRTTVYCWLCFELGLTRSKNG